MTADTPISQAELHAFIDGELSPERASVVAEAVAADEQLAERIAAFASDKSRLAAAYRPVAAAELPAAWIERINRAAAPAPLRRLVTPRANWVMALAACLVLAVGGQVLWRTGWWGEDTILVQAEAARQNSIVPSSRLMGPSLDDPVSRDAMLARVVGLKLRAPDLARLGWHLAEIDTYREAAALRYHAADGTRLTLYVRRSSGAPRFELIKTGALRTCIWQDEVVGAVMMGNMSAGQMMRVASAAYLALDL